MSGQSVSELLRGVADVGRGSDGGYHRPVMSGAERDLATWFVEQSERRGLDVETDGNGVVWAWWGSARAGSLVTGSHLDSVPGGGAFDGPLGVAAALAAVDELRARGVAPRRSLAIAVFPEEEGSRFGVACLGSRLLTGAIDPDAARGLRDRDGLTLAEVYAAAGLDPARLGPDPQRLARVGQFVELHVEQGRGLVDLGRPVAVGSSVLGHGRWRVVLHGRGDHAGTTLMHDRADPVVAAAGVVAAVAALARATPGARATVGRFEVHPGGTNVIASRVEMWLDARHADDATTLALVGSVRARAEQVAAEQGCTVAVSAESWSPTVGFDPDLGARVAALAGDAPLLATGAGHDAGVLAARVPTAMLFARNPTGVSHSPAEHVEDADADACAGVLADVLEGLL